MASASANSERTSTSGLNFGPQWMRNPPQQEPYPQRQFPLAQYRYGREEMLAIFEQIAGKQASSELEPERGPGDIPPDFPEMTDSFQYPVAYQPNNQRNDQEQTRQPQSEIGSNAVIGGRGRGRVFPASGQSRDNGWNGQPRNRPRSDNDFDWRKPGNGDQSPPNDESSWANGSVSPNQQNPPLGGVQAHNDSGWKKGATQNRNGGNQTYWNKGNRAERGWSRSKMPEWLDTDTNEGGAFDHTGNFTEDRRQSRSFEEDPHVDHVTNDRPGSGDSPKEVLEKDDDVFEERNQQLQQHQQQQQLKQRQQQLLQQQHPAMAQPPVSNVPSQGATSNASGGWFEAISMEWFYKDPTNNIQGPFSSNDMAEWFEAGYFKKDLLIRRSCDQEFLSLGQVETRYGTNPFRSTRHPPAFVAPAPAPTISRPPGMGLAPPTQPTVVPPTTTTTAPVTSPSNSLQQGWQSQQPISTPPQSAPARPIAPAQPAMRTLSPIEQVVQLIHSNHEYTSVFKQLMQQITNLEQYAQLPHSHQETLVLQHMAAMYNITPITQPVQPATTTPTSQTQQTAPQRQPPAPVLQQPPVQQPIVDKEEEMKKQMELIRREEEEKRKKEYEKMLEEEKQRAIEAAMKEKEAEFKRQQEALRQQEELLRQQKEKLELEEKKRAEEMKRLEEARRAEEERIRLAEEEARRQIEAAEAIQREEERRLAEIERQRLEEEEAKRKIQEEQMRAIEAERLRQEAEKLAEQERIRKEKVAEAEEKRKKKEEEKRAREKAKKEAEKRRLEEEEQKKLQEQVKQERLKKENEEKEKKKKALQKAAEEKAKAAPQWKTTPQAAPQVQSLAEIQKAESEEMQRQNKIRAQEMEKQKAHQTNNKSQTGWAGLVRGQQRPSPPFNVVPVSPVVNSKKTIPIQPAQMKKTVAKPTPKPQQKPKEELGFWDSAVDAVITDKAHVTNRMTQSSQKAGTEQEKAHVRQLFEKLTVTQMEDPLLAWARVELDNIPNSQEVDIPTFVGFLRELENDYEVEDYARLYFGTGKGVLQFAQRFIEMRRKLKNQSGGGSGEKKKGKKGSRKNKNKANLDLLGFTPAPGDQRNRAGELEGAKI